MSDNPPDDLLTTSEAAEDLRQRESTLASWRATGRGPDFWKLGRAVFYSKQANAEWKAQQRRSPRAKDAA